MRKVAVLAAIAAILAVFVLFIDRRPGDREAGGHRLLVADFDRAAVRRVTITRAGEAPFSLVRQAPGTEPAWRESPGDAAADTAAVEDLLGEIDVAETTRTADLDKAQAGLASPRVTISLDRAGGTATIALGHADAAEGVFARVGGSPAIRVARRRLLDLADRGAEAFRDRRLFPFPATDVARIAWQETGSAEQSLARGGGRWKSQDGSAVVSGRVEEAIRRLLALRATRYLPSTSQKVAVPRVEVGTSDGRRATLAAGSGACGAEETFVERNTVEGACLRIDDWDGARRSLQAALAPDRRLVSSPPGTVKRIEVSEGANRLVLVRASPESWRLEVPKESYLIDPRAVDDWLAAFGRVDARPSSAALEPHARHLVVEGSYREEADVAPGGPGYALLAPDPLRFRDRAVLDFAHFDARRLRRTSAGRSVEVASSDGEDWRAVSPAGAAADRTNAARVVRALGNLHAETFLSEPPPGPPGLTLGVAVQPPGDRQPTERTIEVYKTKEAPGCAGRLDRETSFTLAQATCDELRLPLAK